MYTVADLLPDAQRILGVCDRTMLLRRINSAVELLANKGDFDPYLAVADLCADGRLVALPPDVETPLAVNSCGRPTFGRDRSFSFHLNGPGDLGTASKLTWAWQDMYETPVFVQPIAPSRLFATADNPADTDRTLIVYGLDEKGEKVGRVVGGVFVPGVEIPVGTEMVHPSDALPLFSRIDRVSKAKSRGAISLWYDEANFNNAILLARYEAEWKEPMFRTILLDRPSRWVRVLFRRRQLPLSSDCDLIPLHSLEAVSAMLHALKYYDEGQIEAAQVYEATALRWLSDEQRTRRAPLFLPQQVDGDLSLLPSADQMF